MSQLKAMLKWDFILQSRYKIIHISILSVVMYYLAIVAIPSANNEEFQTLFLFFDPTIIGIMFIGALVLFEKTENTLQALTVTPMETRTYFLSKIISLTTLAVISALLFLFLVHGLEFNYVYMLTGVILTCVFLILVGFLFVARCSSINEYLLMMMLAFLLLLVPPLLYSTGIYEHALIYLWPTQASFILFDGVFADIPLTESVYAVGYLLFWILGCYYLANKAFYKYIVLGGK